LRPPSFLNNPFVLSIDYIKEWAATIANVVSEQTKKGYADEDIGIILSSGKLKLGRYTLLFQKLIQNYAKTNTTVQFDFESLSEEKPVVILCGLKVWCFIHFTFL
jgi:hypothetical protein